MAFRYFFFFFSAPFNALCSRWRLKMFRQANTKCRLTFDDSLIYNIQLTCVTFEWRIFISKKPPINKWRCWLWLKAKVVAKNRNSWRFEQATIIESNSVFNEFVFFLFGSFLKLISTYKHININCWRLTPKPLNNASNEFVFHKNIRIVRPLQYQDITNSSGCHTEGESEVTTYDHN